MTYFTLEQDIEYVRMLIGDTETSPFYPVFSDEEYKMAILRNDGDLRATAISLAISASFQLSSWSTRERTGSIEVWSSLGTNYLKALQFFVDNEGKRIPSGMMPWLAGMDTTEECELRNNPNYPKNALTSITICDSDKVCGGGSRC